MEGTALQPKFGTSGSETADSGGLFRQDAENRPHFLYEMPQGISLKESDSANSVPFEDTEEADTAGSEDQLCVESWVCYHKIASQEDETSAFHVWWYAAIRRVFASHIASNESPFSISRFLMPPEIAPEVDGFIREQAIAREFRQSVELAEECFEITSRSAYVQAEPEHPEEQWLVLRVDATGDYEKIRSQYRAFRRRVREESPRARGLVSLALAIDPR